MAARPAAADPVAALVAKYDLQPHPEGGFYRRHFESGAAVEDATAHGCSDGARPMTSQIHFLLPSGSVSRLHRLRGSDELWFFHAGGPMTVVELTRDRATGAPRATLTVLNADPFDAEAKAAHCVRAGTWFGAFPNEGSAFSFVSCTVTPSFDFRDFEMATRATLAADLGEHALAALGEHAPALVPE